MSDPDTSAIERRRAAIRAELGFPEMRCPRCDLLQEHVHLCATCREETLR